MVADATIPRVTPLVFQGAAAISELISLELGAGTGLFSVELATRHPNQLFIAVDVKADRLQKGAGEATERGLTNIVFIRARADQLDQILPVGSLASFWITFPDPFPKKRAAGRRMTHPHYLKIYEKLLQPDGALYLKHDNGQFFNWSLEQLVAERWHIDELSFDLHESQLHDDYKIKTTYETRWLDEGLVTNFVKVTPPKAYLLK
jgi:tRNA (guanine-N7-)-methyltransferase